MMLRFVAASAPLDPRSRAAARKIGNSDFIWSTSVLSFSVNCVEGYARCLERLIAEIGSTSSRDLADFAATI